MPAILNWLLRLLPANPICMRLVQGGSRRAKHLYVRSGYLAVMMIVLFFGLLGSGNSLRELASRGADAFTVISYGQVALICLLTPVFMAGAIAQEANPRTWDILLTTPLNSPQLVLGNLFGRLFFVLALLFSTLPLFAITQYYGGVPGRSIFLSYAIAASSSLLVATIAVTLSVTRTAGKRAVFVFYVTVVMYLFTTYAWDRYLRPPVGGGSSAFLTTFLTPFNPFLALEALLFTNSYQVHDLAGTDASWLRRLWLERPVAAFNWLCVLISFGLILFSTLRVRVVGTRVGAVPWYRRMLGLPAKGATERPPRRVGVNPIVWRESTAKGNTLSAILARFAFAAAGIVIALSVLWLFHAGRLSAPDLRLAVATIVGAEIVIIVLTALNISATAVSREREDGSLDIILTTPIQPGPYIAGKLRGIIQYLLPMLLVPVVTLALVSIYVMTGGLGRSGGVELQETIAETTTKIMVPVVLPEAAIALPIVLVAFVAFCVMVGLHWSIKSKGSIASVIAAVGVVLAIGGVLGLCGYGAGRSIPFVGAVLCALSPLNLLAALVAPAEFIPRSAEDLAAGRTAIVVGALVSAAAYSAIVFGMHANMKRTFMMTVRRLAGTG